MADIEKRFAYRTDPGSGDKIGTLRYVDPITGDTIYGEQAAMYGHPAKFISIADDVGADATIDYPYKGSSPPTIQSASTTTQVEFSGALGGGLSTTGAVGLLIQILSGSNVNLMRKMISSPGANQYALNLALSVDLAGSETYRLLIDCFRYNAMLIKTEFSLSFASCTIRPWFFSVPQDNVQPTPGVAAAKRYAGQELTISGTDSQVDVTDASHYHGEIAAIGVHGASGACLQVTALSGGTVSVWVALV